MAQIIAEVSRTFNEFLLLPSRTRTGCSPATVDLRTPLVRHRAGEAPAIELHSPFTSAIMQAVSTPGLAIALARNGGLSFLHHNQPVEDQAAAVRQVKNSKAGFQSTARITLVSDQSFQESHANVTPRDTPSTVA